MVAALCKVLSVLCVQIVETYLLGDVSSVSVPCYLHMPIEFQLPACLFLHLSSVAAIL